ncbi:MAG: hypothetical protein H6673_10090 [Anaerolineales bacterium]|nr:hypothetical protein [Anaerolineales bacterium]
MSVTLAASASVSKKIPPQVSVRLTAHGTTVPNKTLAVVLILTVNSSPNTATASSIPVLVRLRAGGVVQVVGRGVVVAPSVAMVLVKQVKPVAPVFKIVLALVAGELAGLVRVAVWALG